MDLQKKKSNSTNKNTKSTYINTYKKDPSLSPLCSILYENMINLNSQEVLPFFA